MDRRAAALAALSGALIGVAVYGVTHPVSPAHTYAQAITAGETRARVLRRPDAEDDALTQDANEAGYRWAERNGIEAVADCPDAPSAYRDGCIDYVREQAAGSQ